jgi:CRISPR/Cas system CSM-associated protein Csm4 (group 5 of RAMP superfamily)
MEGYMGIFVELNNFEVSKRLIFVKNTIHYGAPNYKEMIEELNNNKKRTHKKTQFLIQ